MPNIKSAKKRLRQNIATNARNRSKRSFIRNRCKSVEKAVAAGNVENAEAKLHDAIKVLDKASAGAKRVIHKNAAARKKSRLSAKIKRLKDQTSAKS